MTNPGMAGMESGANCPPMPTARPELGIGTKVQHPTATTSKVEIQDDECQYEPSLKNTWVHLDNQSLLHHAPPLRSKANSRATITNNSKM